MCVMRCVCCVYMDAYRRKKTHSVIRKRMENGYQMEWEERKII